MSNLPLKPLKWVDESDADVKHTAQSALHNYTIQNSEVGKKYEVKYESRRGVKYSPEPATGFATIDDAKTWCWNHYNEKMQPYVKPDSISTYFDKFTQWGLDRGIIQNGNAQAQGLKLASEFGELADNLAKGRCIKDDIGDMMVVLNMLAQMTGVKIEDCLAQAWGDIKDRKGYTNEHGVFIKDSDVEVTK